jgi:ketosteroid isomerase-like protein
MIGRIALMNQGVLGAAVQRGGPCEEERRSAMQVIDVEVEKAVIQKTAAAMTDATNKPGAEGARGYASYATADARWMPPESPAISGREAIARFVSAYTEMKGFRITFEHPHVVVASSGDIAYSVGTYKGTGQDPAGRNQVFEGKFVNVWEKEADGSWRIAVGIWNTNEPAAAPAA